MHAHSILTSKSYLAPLVVVSDVRSETAIQVPNSVLLLLFILYMGFCILCCDVRFVSRSLR